LLPSVGRHTRKEKPVHADVWRPRDGVARLADEMAGYDVETRDGEIGTVDRVSYSGNCLYVSAGRIKKHRYVIPAGAVAQIDPNGKLIQLTVTKEQVETSPRYDSHRGFDDEFERKTGAYYNDLLRRLGGERSAPGESAR
jgi:hypothetical protein